MRSVCVMFAAAMCSLAASAAGIDYPALFQAIAFVESSDGVRSRNVYQLTGRYLSDLERITGERWSYSDTALDRARSMTAMRTYWAYYSSRQFQRGTSVPSTELLAKIHHVGYVGLRTRKDRAEAYWKKVKPLYEKFRRK